MALTAEQVAHFREQGFVFLPGFAAASIPALVQRMAKLVEEFNPSENHTTFDTVGHKQASDDYFLTSGDKIRFFLEDEAMVDGKLVRDKALALNKCGHALHTQDDVFRVFCSDARIRDVVTSLGYVQPTVIQSMYIFKPPHIGGVVQPHQDSSFMLTEPPSCLGMWFAVDDASAANGCLWVAPGSHKRGLTRRFALTEDRKAGRYIPADAPATPEIKDEEYICVEAKRGDCLVFDGGLVHKSEKNSSDVQRNAFTMHIVDARYPMVPDCWLQTGCACLPLCE